MKKILKYIIYNIFSVFIFQYGNKKNIYITFDDGPHPDNTLNIINILRKENIKATFFMVGNEMEKHPEVVNAVVNDGHRIGYHSYSHESLKQVTFKEFLKDLNKTRLLEEKFKIKFKYYRPPYGDLSLLTTMWLIFNRWKIAMWSLDSMDSFKDKKDVIKLVSPENINDGEILLFHDDYKLTVDVLPVILERIKNKGFQCEKL